MAIEVAKEDQLYHDETEENVLLILE